MKFGILGPLEVVKDGESVALPGTRPRALLALLLLHANEVVSAERLIDALWEDAPPHNAANALQTTASRLRKHLGDPDAIRTRAPGYSIDVGEGGLDLAVFERLVGDAREALDGGQPEAAARLARDALGVWRGPALADLAGEGYLSREAARLDEERRAALELRIEADLESGRHVALVGELEALVAEHPYRESLRGLLMLALYRSGRQAEALEAYQRARRLLVDELGIEPSRALQDLERSILVQDASLDATRPTAEPAPTPPSEAPGRRSRIAVAVAAVLAAVGVAIAAGAVGRRDSSRVPSLAPNSLGVIDPLRNRLVAQTRVGELPVRVAVGEGGIWVLNAGDRTVSRIDPRSKKVVRTVPVAGGAELAGLAAGEGGVWVGRGLAGPLFVDRISPAFNEIAASAGLGAAEQPFYAARWAVAVGQGSVWVPGGRYGTILRLDHRTLEVRATVDTGIHPVAIAVGPSAIWVAGSRNRVVRIDPSTHKVVDRLRVPTGARAIAVGAGAAWVTSTNEDVVARIDSVTHTVTTIRVGDLPTAVAVGEGAIWVANGGDGTVSRIDPATREVVETIEVGAGPEAIAVGYGVVWVATSAGRGA